LWAIETARSAVEADQRERGSGFRCGASLAICLHQGIHSRGWARSNAVQVSHNQRGSRLG